MQPTLVAGDTLKFTVTLSSYPAGQGWALHYRLTPRNAGAAITFDATASGDDHAVDVPAATTANWQGGNYTCAAWVTLGAERYTIASECGQVTLQPNPAALPAGTDTRSDAERALAAVTALVMRKATAGDEMYKVNGRELKFYPLPDLIKLQQRLRGEVDRERVAAGLAPLYGAPNSVKRILLRVA